MRAYANRARHYITSCISVECVYETLVLRIEHRERDGTFGDIKIAFCFAIDARLSYELDAEVSQATPITLSWRTQLSLARAARIFTLSWSSQRRSKA